MVLVQELKALYMFGNCQRPVFTLGVSHRNHKTTKFGLNIFGHRSCEKMIKKTKKNTIVRRICVPSDRNKRLLARRLLLLI